MKSVLFCNNLWPSLCCKTLFFHKNKNKNAGGGGGWGWFKNTYALKFQLWWQQLKSVSFFVDIKGYKKGARRCSQSLSSKLCTQRGYIPFSSSLLCLPHLASPIQNQYIVYVLCSNLKVWLYFGFFFYKEEKLHWKTFNSFKKKSRLVHYKEKRTSSAQGLHDMISTPSHPTPETSGSTSLVLYGSLFYTAEINSSKVMQQLKRHSNWFLHLHLK